MTGFIWRTLWSEADNSDDDYATATANISQKLSETQTVALQRQSCHGMDSLGCVLPPSWAL